MKLGTPLSDTAVRVMLLGGGELGKEVAIELQRLGVEVIAADRYAHAPAMQVAHRSHVLNMLDPAALRALIEPSVSAQSIEQQAIHDGMRPLTQSALQLARDKLIPLNEVYRVRLE